MKNKILKSLTPVFGIASFIMFLSHSVSGWVWFSLLLIFIFLSEYNEQ